MRNLRNAGRAICLGLFLTGMAVLGACTVNGEVVSTPTPAGSTSGDIIVVPTRETSFWDDLFGKDKDGKNETSTPTPTDTPTPTATPTPTNTPTPIPTVPAAPQALNTDVKNTITFLVNRDYLLPDGYVPPELEYVQIKTDGSTAEKNKMRPEAARALNEMNEALKADTGYELIAISGYRSYETQYTLYGNYIIRDGIPNTNYYSAVPGSSEHQTGLAMDLSGTSLGYVLSDDFEKTVEGKWIKDNCWKFGYIVRYRKDKSEITGYAYEPWHVRYVGVPLAYYLYCNDMTLEEYYGATESKYTREYLNNNALIDTTTTKFYKLYESNKGGALIYLSDKSVWVSEENVPYLIPAARTGKNAIAYNSKWKMYIAPAVKNIWDEYIIDGDSMYVVAKKAYLTKDGKVWTSEKGDPFYLDPVLNPDGTFFRDKKGNIVYNTVITDKETGEPFIGTDGLPVQTVAKRDTYGAVLVDGDGNPEWFTPLEDEGGAYMVDTDGTLCFDEGVAMSGNDYLDMLGGAANLMSAEEWLYYFFSDEVHVGGYSEALKAQERIEIKEEGVDLEQVLADKKAAEAAANGGQTE